MNLKTSGEYISFDTSEPERIKIVDSDKEYVGYFIDNETGRKLADELACKIRNAQNDIEAALAVYYAVESISLIINPSTSLLQQIIDNYGQEYVNRIGNNYLIVDA